LRQCAIILIKLKKIRPRKLWRGCGLGALGRFKARSLLLMPITGIFLMLGNG
jgi:hypothetical protein